MVRPTCAVEDSFDINGFVEGEMKSHGHQMSKQVFVEWMSFNKPFSFEMTIVETLIYGEIELSALGQKPSRPDPCMNRSTSSGALG